MTSIANTESADAPTTVESHIQETIQILSLRRDEAHARVAALDKEIAKLLGIAGVKVSQLERLRSAPFRYASQSLIDAIELYLHTKGACADREELCVEMVDGGAMVGRDPRYSAGNVKKSIDYHLRAESPRLKEVNGLIGLPEWPDEKFQTSGT